MGVRAASPAAMESLSGQVQARGAQEGGRCVERSRQRCRLDDRGPPAGLEESHPLVPANLVFDSNTPVELDQVSAAAEQNVLTVVHHFTRPRMLIGGRPATQVRAALEEGDTKAVFRQCATGGQSCEAAPHHGNFWRLCPALRHQTRRFTKPFPRMMTFSRTVRRIFLPKTSYLRREILSSRRR